MAYQDRWLLAVALKRPYPSVETGAEDESAGSEKSSKVGYVVLFGLGALLGGFIGNSMGQQTGFESGKLYAKNRTQWRANMRSAGIDPDTVRGIYD